MTDPTTYLEYEDCVKLERGAGNTRDRIIIGLMFRCGMRVSEVMRLKKKDLIFEKDPIKSVIIATGKKRGTSKPRKRRIPIQSGLQMRLRAYSEVFKPMDFIFPSPYRPGHARSVRWAQYMLDRVASTTNITHDKGGKKIHPHTLRHSLAIFLVMRGVKLSKIQQILGHASLSSTSYYLQFSHSEIAEDYHAAFGGVK